MSASTAPGSESTPAIAAGSMAAPDSVTATRRPGIIVSANACSVPSVAGSARALSGSSSSATIGRARATSTAAAAVDERVTNPLLVSPSSRASCSRATPIRDTLAPRGPGTTGSRSRAARRYAAGDAGAVPAATPDALVLGAGGVLGEAWMTGVLCDRGLLRIRFADAETFVGTSAGSIVAAGLVVGEPLRRPRALAELRAHMAPRGLAADARSAAPTRARRPQTHARRPQTAATTGQDWLAGPLRRRAGLEPRLSLGRTRARPRHAGRSAGASRASVAHPTRGRAWARCAPGCCARARSSTAACGWFAWTGAGAGGSSSARRARRGPTSPRRWPPPARCRGCSSPCESAAETTSTEACGASPTSTSPRWAATPACCASTCPLSSGPAQRASGRAAQHGGGAAAAETVVLRRRGAEVQLIGPSAGAARDRPEPHGPGPRARVLAAGYLQGREVGGAEARRYGVRASSGAVTAASSASRARLTPLLSART